MARTWRGDADLFFRDLIQGRAAGLQEDADEAEAFYGELTGGRHTARRELETRRPTRDFDAYSEVNPVPTAPTIAPAERRETRTRGIPAGAFTTTV